MKTNIFIYVMLINFFSFVVMIFDKYRAHIREYRVPEKWFFIISLLGGGVGAFIAMRLVKHKTQHWAFVYGIPLCILLHFIILYPLMWYPPSEWWNILSNAF